MLGKILKYEFKSTYKIITPLILAVLVLSLILRFQLTAMDSINFNERAIGYQAGLGLSIFFYIMLIFATSIVTFIVLVTRFYKTMFGDEGYLTLTLPCQPDLLMNGKALAFFIWNLAISATCILSFFIIGFSKEVLGFIADMFDGLRSFIYEDLGVAPVIFYTIIILICLISIIMGIYKIIMCLAIGQLSNSHKVGFAVLAFLGTNFAVGIIDMILSLVFQLGNIGSIYSISMVIDDYSTAFFRTLIFTLVKYIVYTVVMYFISHYIINKKLNLE